jgi:hypothetical protein
MRWILWLALLTSGAVGAEDWTRHMSPRMREAFAPMVRSDWKPQREVELTGKEKEQLQELFRPLVDQVRRRPVLLEPGPAPGSEVRRLPEAPAQ